MLTCSTADDSSTDLLYSRLFNDASTQSMDIWGRGRCGTVQNPPVGMYCNVSLFAFSVFASVELLDILGYATLTVPPGAA